MISTAVALAPAGAFGWASADARPYGCTAVRPSVLPPVAVAVGTRVPAAGMARRRDAEQLAGFGAGTATALPATPLRATDLPATDQHDPITQNDGTTPLGIHPRGRSTS